MTTITDNGGFVMFYPMNLTSRLDRWTAGLAWLGGPLVGAIAAFATLFLAPPPNPRDELPLLIAVLIAVAGTFSMLVFLLRIVIEELPERRVNRIRDLMNGPGPANQWMPMYAQILVLLVGVVGVLVGTVAWKDFIEHGSYGRPLSLGVGVVLVLTLVTWWAARTSKRWWQQLLDKNHKG